MKENIIIYLFLCGRRYEQNVKIHHSKQLLFFSKILSIHSSLLYYCWRNQKVYKVKTVTVPLFHVSHRHYLHIFSPEPVIPRAHEFMSLGVYPSLVGSPNSFSLVFSPLVAEYGAWFRGLVWFLRNGCKRKWEVQIFVRNASVFCPWWYCRTIRFLKRANLV